MIQELLGLVVIGATDKAIEKALNRRRWGQIILLLVGFVFLAALLYITIKFS
ncbi:MAG TPA: hypothetical protein VFH22_13520 [Rhodocyclaceae bacterium]|nr:hypothetical protein [Rhodocyclaceae bacterium]